MINRPRFTLTLRVERDDKLDPTGYLRLRRALKCLLRSFGLRCTAYSEVKTEPANTIDDCMEGKSDA